MVLGGTLQRYATSPDTAEEKDKFLDDALRLAEDISGNQTFYTVKPLLNFWAAFVPSKEVMPLTTCNGLLTASFAERCWRRRQAQRVRLDPWMG